MWLKIKVCRNLSSMTVPAATAAKVAIESTGPAQTFATPSFPCVEIESEPTKTASASAPIPYSAMRRACVEENSEITRINKMGLTNHSGTEPLPPGLPSKTASGPPPGISRPGSVKNLLG